MLDMKQAVLLCESSGSSRQSTLRSLTRDDWDVLEQFVVIGRVLQTAMLEVRFLPASSMHTSFQFEKDNALLSESWLLVIGLCKAVAHAAATNGGECAVAMSAYIQREILRQYREPIVEPTNMNARWGHLNSVLTISV